MSVLPIIQLTREEFEKRETPLRLVCTRVVDFGEEFQRAVDDLIETFNHHRIAVGLAAPQVGIQLQVAAINVSAGKKDTTLVVVNPEIIESSGKKDKKKETCMSLPHYCGEVERRDKITISYQDRIGQQATLSTRGFLARVIAHEIDHLAGKLYIDRMKSLDLLEPIELFRRENQ